MRAIDKKLSLAMLVLRPIGGAHPFSDGLTLAEGRKKTWIYSIIKWFVKKSK